MLKVTSKLFIFFIIALIYGLGTSSSFGDDVSDGWTIGLSCPSSGVEGSGAFTFENSSINGTAGTCTRLDNSFTELVLGSASGTGTEAASQVYAVHTGDVLIIPPLLTGETEPIFTVANAAPSGGTYNANWINVQWNTGTATLTGFYVIGASSINPSSSPGSNGVVITNQWDVQGNEYYSGSVNMNGSWGTGGSVGIYTSSSNGGNLDGTAYFNAAGAGVFKSTPGKATFFFPQQSVPFSAIAGQNFSGIAYDAAGDILNVLGSSDKSGQHITVEYYTNVPNGTIYADSSLLDTITLSAANSPANGIMVGTVSRTGSGVTNGTGDIACIADTTSKARIICSGQTPGNTSVPYNISLVSFGVATVFSPSEVTEDGIYTVAGNGTGGSVAAPSAATSTEFNTPGGVAVDSLGNLYVGDQLNGAVRMIVASSGTYFGQTMTRGNAYVIAGGSYGYSPDGTTATSGALGYPAGVAIDSSGNLYIAESGNQIIRMVPATTGTYFGRSMTANTLYTIAGNGVAAYSGDGSAATSAEIHSPVILALDTAGNVYFSDANNNAVRVVAAANGTHFGITMTAGNIYTVAGHNASGAFAGDGGAATLASLNVPSGIAFDTSGNLYIADSSNNAVRMVPTTSTTYFGQSMTANHIYTIAGQGGTTGSYAGDFGLATSASLNAPASVAIDVYGDVVICDSGNNIVRTVASQAVTYNGFTSTANYIYPAAGTGGSPGYSGDTGLAYSAQLHTPGGVAIDSSDNVYISDESNNVIRAMKH